MEKTENYVLIGQYFSYEEAESIKGRFIDQDIEFLITDHGPNLELEAKYYQIKVRPAQFNEAQHIVQKEKDAFFSAKTKCPKCGHSVHEKIKKSMVDRVVYAGTDLVQCLQCGTKFGI
jgi:uncharacterized protein with PIN domain